MDAVGIEFDLEELEETAWNVLRSMSIRHQDQMSLDTGLSKLNGVGHLAWERGDGRSGVVIEGRKDSGGWRLSKVVSIPKQTKITK